MDARLFRGTFQGGYQTQTAATPITQIIPGVTGAIARVTNLLYRPAATAHDLFIMRPCASATAASACDGTSLVMSTTFNNPLGTEVHTPANLDLILYKLDNGLWQLNTISAWSTLTATITDPGASRQINAGETVYLLGVSSDAWHTKFETTASVTNEYTDKMAGIAEGGLPSSLWTYGTYGNRSGLGDPLLFYSGNATNAGFLRGISGYYSKT